MLSDRMLFPHDPGFSAAAWLEEIASPRTHDTPALGEWIDAAARQYNLRAEWLVMTAQKEQSFVTRAAGGSGWQRALDWTMGFGATEGGDLPAYAGTRNQVFSAARGLRRYLTPGDNLYVGDWVGQALTRDGETRTVRNLAEAAALQYTPHWSTFGTVERIWQAFGFEEVQPMHMQAEVAEIAEEVLRRAGAGELSFRVNGVPFEARDQARCSEFVREAHAAVTGTLWPPWAGRFACWTERNLRRQGYRIEEPVRGCIVAFCRDEYDRHGRETLWNATKAWVEARGAYGHVAIYLGEGRVAENSRGFGIRTLDQVGRDRISGYYAPLPISVPQQREVLVVVMDPDTEHGRTYEVMVHEDGRLFVPVRETYEDQGYNVHAEHLPGRQRVYVKATPQVIEVAQRMLGGDGDGLAGDADGSRTPEAEG